MVMMYCAADLAELEAKYGEEPENTPDEWPDDYGCIPPPWMEM